MKGPKLTRRTLLRTLGAAAAPLPFASLTACSSGPGGSSPGAPAIPAALTQGWATGGTAAMTGDHADPFAAGHGATCTLTCSATVGPCHAQTVARRDISEGHAGLPTRLSFLLLDTSCQPVAGAEVDLWHAAPEGVYSGQFIYSGAKAEVAVGNILPVGNLVEGAFLPISFANDAAM